MINSVIIKQCLLALLSQDAGTNALDMDLLAQDKLAATTFGECLTSQGYSVDELFENGDNKLLGVGGSGIRVPPTANSPETKTQTVKVGGTGIKNPPVSMDSNTETQTLRVGGSGVRNPPK